MATKLEARIKTAQANVVETKAKRDELVPVVKTMMEDSTDDAELSESDQKKFDDTLAEFKSSVDAFEAAQKTLDRLKALAEADDVIGAALEGAGLKDVQGDPFKALATPIGQRIYRDPAFRKFLDNLPASGTKGVQSPMVRFEGNDERGGGLKALYGGLLGNKTLHTTITPNADGITTVGPLMVARQLGLIEQLDFDPPVVRPLFANGETDADIIDYVVQTMRVNNARGVAEADGTKPLTDSLASYKPLSWWTTERRSTQVKDIAHRFEITRKALRNVPMAEAKIRREGIGGLEEVIEWQLINGAGGDDLTGLENTPGTQVWSNAGDMLRAIREAITQVTVNGLTLPTAIVTTPIVAQELDLAKDNNGQYFVGNPFNYRPFSTLWGLPVFTSKMVPDGVAWIANWKKGDIWDRGRLNVDVTDSHGENWAHNIYDFRFEVALAFCLIRPEAFLRLDGMPV